MFQQDDLGGREIYPIAVLDFYVDMNERQEDIMAYDGRGSLWQDIGLASPRHSAYIVKPLSFLLSLWYGGVNPVPV